MKWIAAILLIGVFVRHNSSYWFAEITGYSPQGVFYILGGLWEIVLCSVLLFIVAAATRSIWRQLAITALVICILEASQVAACRIAVKQVSRVPKGSNLCDYATGLPIGATMVTLYIIIICFVIIKRK